MGPRAPVPWRVGSRPRPSHLSGRARAGVHPGQGSGPSKEWRPCPSRREERRLTTQRLRPTRSRSSLRAPDRTPIHDRLPAVRSPASSASPGRDCRDRRRRCNHAKPGGDRPPLDRPEISGRLSQGPQGRSALREFSRRSAPQCRERCGVSADVSRSVAARGSEDLREGGGSLPRYRSWRRIVPTHSRHRGTAASPDRAERSGKLASSVWAISKRDPEAMVIVDWLGRGGIAHTTEAWVRERSARGRATTVVTRGGRELRIESIPDRIGVGSRGGALIGHAAWSVPWHGSALWERSGGTIVLQGSVLPQLELPVARAARRVGIRSSS